jgi:hypothetical protein
MRFAMSFPRSFALVLLIVAAAHPARAQSPRDGAQPVIPVGSAVLSGIVTTAGPDATALRRVTVTAQSSGLPGAGGQAITDDNGRFVIGNLPAGRYTVSAAKAAYLPAAYGAPPVSGPASLLGGTAVVVANGQHIGDLTITMTRGAVVTGTIRDPAGHPASGFLVSAHYYSRSTVTGERALTRHPSRAVTDDRGVYRIFGLHPGEYLLAAAAGTSTFSDLRPTSDADVRWAQEWLRRPGSIDVNSPEGAPMRRENPIVGLVPTYYPGTPLSDQATAVRVNGGDVRTGIDVQVQLVPTTRVAGVVTMPDGRPATSTFVRARSADGTTQSGSSAVTGEDGRFVLRGLTPGTHVVIAQRTLEVQGGTGVSVTPLIAMTTVASSGSEVSVNLTLRRGATISGRVVFDAGETGTPPDMGRVRVSLLPPPGQTPPSVSTPTARPDASGSFRIAGVAAGRYVLAAVVASPSEQSEWAVTAATIGGMDAHERSVDIAADAQFDDVVIRLANRGTELAGTMFDAAGLPAPEYFIVVFPADREFWTVRSARIRQTRPASDGTFSVRLLPPGDYLLAALTEIERGQWFDPEFLAQLETGAIRISLANGQKVVQDIRVR